MKRERDSQYSGQPVSDCLKRKAHAVFLCIQASAATDGENKNDSRNVGLPAVQPSDAAASRRKFY